MKNGGGEGGNKRDPDDVKIDEVDRTRIRRDEIMQYFIFIFIF